MRSFTEETCAFRPAGAAEGWEQVVGRYGARLERAVRGALRRAGQPPCQDQVEEALQETYCRLLEAGSRRLLACRGDSTEQVSAYLGRMAERVVLDEVRQRQAAKRGRGRLVQLSDLGTSVADPKATPEDRLLLAERGRLLFERCRHLGGPHNGRRNARILRLALAGWSSAEISRAIGGLLAPATIDKLVWRLKSRLAGEGVALPRRRGGPAPRAV